MARLLRTADSRDDLTAIWLFIRRMETSPFQELTLDEARIRDGLVHAAKQVEEGDVREWSFDEIKTVGRLLFSRRDRHE